MITVDSVSYPQLSVTELRRTVTMEERGGGGDTLSGKYLRDAGGARYRYDLVIGCTDGGSDGYDALFDVLAVDTVHEVILPWGGTVKQFKAHVTALSDMISRFHPNGTPIFSGMHVTFRAESLI